ncbi:putative transcription initiation protein [Trypanosoma vivax]|nr:putative transcription initiation protein [Trypanosoma vivax]
MEEELSLGELTALLGDGALPDVRELMGHSDQKNGSDSGPNKKAREKRRRSAKQPRRHSKIGTKLSGTEDESEDDTENESLRRRSRYVIDAAESGESESVGSSFAAKEEENEDVPTRDEVSAYEPRKTYIFREGEENMTSEELARAIEERYRTCKKNEGRTGALLHSGVSRGKLSSFRYASHLLPQKTDPKVFSVKCRPRMARLLVARIVNKCYAYRNGWNYGKCKVDLGIISVFSLDHVQEYIYIEAHRKAFVENALNGLEGLFCRNISLVSPTELLQMMEQRHSTDKIHVGSFVRLRQKQYRLDIAQVVEVDHTSRRVTVKVVPREDFLGKSYIKSEVRPPQRLFVPSLATNVLERGEYYFWGQLKFDKDGYLLLNISQRMVIAGSKMEKPTVEELAVFHDNDRERVRQTITRFAHSNPQHSELRIGNTVRVASGQLQGMIGAIENIFTDTSTVALSYRVPGKAASIKLRVELSACVKHFEEGAHVIVDSGDHAGESGTVVKTSDDVVYILSDRATASREFVVRANDCRQSNLVGSFSHTLGSWKLFDLVLLPDASSVGCIVRLNRNDVCVLTDRRETRYLSAVQIKAVTAGTRRTTDRLSNIITRGSEVNIEADPSLPYYLVGQTGRVEQVFNTTLFVRVRGVRENAGLTVVSANHVLVFGGRTTLKQIQPPRQLPAAKCVPHNAVKADIPAPNPGMVSEEWANNSEWYETDAV